MHVAVVGWQEDVEVRAEAAPGLAVRIEAASGLEARWRAAV